MDESQANRDPVTGRFGPGNNANPKGRPTGSSIRAHIERMAEDVEAESGRSRGEILAEVMWKAAMAGDTKVMEMMLKRFWPEKLALEHSGSIVSDEEILAAQRRAGLIGDGTDE